MSDASPPPALKRRLVVALLASFACGVVLGGAGVGVAARLGLGPYHVRADCPPHPGAGQQPAPPGAPPEDMPVRLADKLCAELQLGPELKEPVREIFREGHAEAQPLRQRTDEAFKAIFSRQNDKIRALLTPDQRERFNTLLAGWERRHPPGPPPP
jgi:hypothetical protein